jgi:hypothetical protein
MRGVSERAIGVHVTAAGTGRDYDCVSAAAKRGSKGSGPISMNR